MIKIRIRLFVIGLFLSVSPVFAGSDAKLVKSWEESHLVSRGELTRMFKEAIRRTEEFAVLAGNKALPVETRKKKLLKAIAEANRAMFASKTFLAFQDTSAKLDAHMSSIDGSVDRLPALIQSASFKKVTTVARQAKGELKTVAGLFELKL